MAPTHPAAKVARDKYRQSQAFFEDLALQTPVLEGADYDLSKYALEGPPEAVKGSFEIAGVQDLGGRLIGIAQRNTNSSFELARSLAGCGNIFDVVKVQMAFWNDIAKRRHA
jgi:hypothetical protein